MAKKAVVKKIKPSEAIAGLKEYHDSVVILVQVASSILPHVDERVRGNLNSAIQDVKSHYEAES